MSQTVDQRIVKMKFDNAQFEQNAGHTLKTLDKLKQALKFDDASESLNKIQNTATRLDLSQASHSVESLSLRFSALEVVAITALQNITSTALGKFKSVFDSTIGQIISGGRRRALNLEQARFSMSGYFSSMGDSADEVSEKIGRIMGAGGPVQAAVDGTAYSLDEAAKAASNFLASGVSIEELADPLRAISGVAAQTGASYDDIANIFTRIAGNGRVYAIDLQSLSSRGLNAAAAIARSMGITEQAAREMVSKGKISFEDFTKAMSGFADNATEANKTYTGALSNMKSALSRIGAKFYDEYGESQGHLKNMRDIFNALRIAINSVNAALDPLINLINKGDAKLRDFTVALVDSFHVALAGTKAIENGATNSVGWVVDVFKNLIDASKDLFFVLKELFFGPTKKFLDAVGSTFSYAFKKLYENVNRILDPLRKLSTLFDVLYNGHALPFKELNMDPATKSMGKYLAVFNRFHELYLNFQYAASKTLGIIVDYWTSLTDTFTKYLLPIFVKFGSIVAKVLSVFFDFYSNILEIISENYLIQSFFEQIGTIIFKILGPALDWLDRIIKTLLDYKISPFLEKITISFSKFANELGNINFIDGILKAFYKLNNILRPVGLKLEYFIRSFSIVDVIERFKNSLNGLITRLQPIINKIKEFGKTLKDNLSLDSFDFKKWSVLVAEGGILALLLQRFIVFKWFRGTLRNKLKALVEPLQLGLDIASDFKKLVGGIKGLVFDLQYTLDTRQIKNIAVALLLLAGALLVLSMIDTPILIRNMAVITALIFQLEVALDSIKKSMAGKTILDKGPMGYLIGIAAAVLILSIALKSLSKIDSKSLFLALIAMASIFTMLGGFLIVLEAVNAKKCVSGLIGLAIAISILAGVVKILGSMDQNALEKGVNALSNIVLIVGLFMSAITIVSSYTGFSGGNMFKGIIGMAISMLILAKVVEKLGSLEINVLTNGIEALGAILLILGMFMTLSDGYGSAAISASLIAIAISMLIFQKAIEKLGAIPFENLMLGLGSMLAILMAIAAMFVLLPNDAKVLSTAAALLIMGIALNTFALALKVIASIPFTSLIKSIGAIVVVLGIFAGLAFVFGSMWQILLPGVGIIVALAGAMALFGAGLLAVAVAITLISPLLVIFSSNLILAARVIFNGIVALGEDIVKAIVTIIKAIFAAIRETIPDLLETLTVLLDAFLTFFEDNISRLIETGYKLVMGILTGLTEKMPEIVNAGFSVLIAFIDGLATALMERGDEVGAAAGRLIEGLIMGLWDAAVGLFKEVKEFARQLIEDYFGVDLSETSLVEIGKNLIQGLWNGIKEKTRELLDSLWDWGKVLVGRMGEAVGVKSPSWMFKEIGEYCMDGLAIGLSKVMNPMNAVDEAGNNILSAFRSTMSNIEDVINSDMNMQPTVTPVLDLSQIQNGVSTMNGMFGLTNGMTASISGKLAAMRSHQADNDLKAIAETIKKANDTPTVNMTVYGAQGQDVRELAEIVSNRIQHQLSRREMALG